MQIHLLFEGNLLHAISRFLKIYIKIQVTPHTLSSVVYIVKKEIRPLHQVVTKIHVEEVKSNGKFQNCHF